MQTLGVVVTVGGDAREENPAKASLKSHDLVLCGLRKGCSWDPRPIICCLRLPFPYPERGVKVAFPPACLPRLGRRGEQKAGLCPAAGLGAFSLGPQFCKQRSQA